jgi:hypothetical protein
MFCEGAEKVSLQIICGRGSQITSLVETPWALRKSAAGAVAVFIWWSRLVVDIFQGGVTREPCFDEN